MKIDEEGRSRTGMGTSRFDIRGWIYGMLKEAGVRIRRVKIDINVASI